MNNYTNDSIENNEDIAELKDIKTIEIWEALCGNKSLSNRTRHIMKAHILLSAKMIKEKPETNTESRSDRELIFDFYKNKHTKTATSLAAPRLSHINSGLIPMIACGLIILINIIVHLSR